MTTIDLTKYVGKAFWMGQALSDIPRQCLLEEDFIKDYRIKKKSYDEELKKRRQKLKE